MLGLHCRRLIRTQSQPDGVSGAVAHGGRPASGLSKRSCDERSEGELPQATAQVRFARYRINVLLWFVMCCCARRDRVVKRRTKELVQELALQLRGLLGTEYAIQTCINYNAR